MDKNKIVNIKDSGIKIIGDNILYCNGVITAYYILPLNNYTITSDTGVLVSIQNITNLLSGLANQRQDVKFSIQRFSKIIRKNDVISNLSDTIKLYAPTYEIPQEFIKNLGNSVQDYCLLGVGIEEKDLMKNIEDATLKETAKDLLSNLANNLLNIGKNTLDEDKILQSENNIFSVLRSRCTRASRELVFYNYISKLYPCYNISYDKFSYINEDNFSNILGSVTQTIEDNFGYFIMHNEGVDIFDLSPQDTYGCILTIKAFPDLIDSVNFSMDYPGMQVNIHTIPKEEALIQLKRIRASLKYEHEQGDLAGAEIEQLESTAKAIAIATHAINNIEEQGVQTCEFIANILIIGLSLSDLRQNIQSVMSDLKDRNIIAAKSLTQARDFLDSYVKLNPKDYEHFTNLQFPLSFQLNRGALVGDSDGKFYVPLIGEDLA